MCEFGKKNKVALWIPSLQTDENKFGFSEHATKCHASICHIFKLESWDYNNNNLNAFLFKGTHYSLPKKLFLMRLSCRIFFAFFICPLFPFIRKRKE